MSVRSDGVRHRLDRSYLTGDDGGGGQQQFSKNFG